MNELDELFDEGVALGREGKYDEAIEKYGKAIDPNIKDGYINFGDFLSILAGLARGDTKQELYSKAIAKYKKAIELDPNNERVYYNWGTVLSTLGDLASGDKRQELYREAIEKYAKATQLDTNFREVYNNWGNSLSRLGGLEGGYQRQDLYREAIEKYVKAIELDPNFKVVYINWGNALAALAGVASGDISQALNREAIEKYVKAIELDPNDNEAYNNWGNVLYALAGVASGDKSQELYRKAIEKYSKAIELYPSYNSAYFNWGVALSNLALLADDDKSQELYREAIEKYSETIKLNPNHIGAYYNWGTVLSALGELASGDERQELYKEAIEKYSKTIKLDPNYNEAYNNLGFTLFALAGLAGGDKNQDLYSKATEKHSKAIELDLNYFMAQKTIYESAKDIATCFSNARRKIFDILSNGKNSDGKKDLKLIEEIFNYMLDADFKRASPIEFFTQLLKECKIDYSTESESEFKQLKDIYIQSLLIISLLHVENENENNVAHYTSISTAKLMLFKNKDQGAEPTQLRMASASMTNDPKEGITLLDFLDIETTNDKSKEKQAAFLGCFSFNHNNLTQFRLYGNKENVEGTGLSIVVQNNLFSSSMTDCLSLGSIMTGDNQPAKIDTKENRFALYRCIYLDPDVEQVISLGHRDEYAFYLSKEEEKITDYNKEINDKLEAVRTAFSTLKELIYKYKGDPAILTPLLLQLRYLTKHAAFKEEQECRILDIENIAGENDKIKYDDRINKMYINYAQIEKRHLCCIYFAPKAADYTLFCNRLKLNGIDCPCKKSEHPLA